MSRFNKAVWLQVRCLLALYHVSHDQTTLLSIVHAFRFTPWNYIDNRCMRSLYRLYLVPHGQPTLLSRHAFRFLLQNYLHKCWIIPILLELRQTQGNRVTIFQSLSV